MHLARRIIATVGMNVEICKRSDLFISDYNNIFIKTIEKYKKNIVNIEQNYVVSTIKHDLNILCASMIAMHF